MIHIESYYNYGVIQDPVRLILLGVDGLYKFYPMSLIGADFVDYIPFTTHTSIRQAMMEAITYRRPAPTNFRQLSVRADWRYFKIDGNIITDIQILNNF